MRIIRFGFDKDPSVFLSEYITGNKFDLPGTILIVPTQRFRKHFSRELLKTQSKDILFAPSIITPFQMITELSLMTGIPLASRFMCYSMFKKAVRKTNGVELLFNPSFIDSFKDFCELSDGYLGAFREINEQKVDLYSIRTESLPVAGYEGFEEQFSIFKKLYHNYIIEQSSSMDPGFAINLIRKEHVIRYFAEFKHVVLVNPVALTRFEKWVYSVIEDKLHVLYQDTNEFDFGRILGYRAGTSACASTRDFSISPADIFYSEEPTKTKQALAIIDTVFRLIEQGKNPDEIIILNIDSDFSELLYMYLHESGVEINFSEGLPLRNTPIYRFLSLIHRYYTTSMDRKVLGRLLRNDISREILEREGIPLSGRDSIITPERTGKNGDGFDLRPLVDIMNKIYHSKNFDLLYGGIKNLFGLLVKSRTAEYYSARELVLEKVFSLREMESDFNETPLEVLLFILRNEKYPIVSESMRGIQLLGLLETRGLSFPYVFIPSFNEGIIPKVVPKLKLFSSTLRKAIGLIPSQDREILQFYHIKRLIDGSKISYIFSIRDKNGKYDTRSRFYYLITEKFIDERAKKLRPLDSGYLVPFKSSVKELTVYPGYSQEIDLPPGGLRMDELSRYDVQLLKDCKTRFYISRILGIKDESLSLRGLDHSLLGTLVHQVMNLVYGGFKSGLPDEKEAVDRLEALIDEKFPAGLFNTGEEIVTREILKKKLERIIKNDFRRFAEGWRIEVDLLERELETEIDVGGTYYCLKGILDRVDLSPDEEYHIIDYKTGNIPLKTLHMPERDFKEVQLGFYGLLFSKNYPDRKLGGLYYYDILGDGELVQIVNGVRIEDYLNLFHKHIIDFIIDVSSARVFGLTEDPVICSYCSFQQICRVLEGAV